MQALTITADRLLTVVKSFLLYLYAATNSNCSCPRNVDFSVLVIVSTIDLMIVSGLSPSEKNLINTVISSGTNLTYIRTLLYSLLKCTYGPLWDALSPVSVHADLIHPLYATQY